MAKIICRLQLIIFAGETTKKRDSIRHMACATWDWTRRALARLDRQSERRRLLSALAEKLLISSICLHSPLHNNITLIAL